MKRGELGAAADRFELMVEDRRVKDSLIEALAASRRVRLTVLLDDLPRVRLKEICRALGLDDPGREKATLITRLADEVPAAGPTVKAAPSLALFTQVPPASHPTREVSQGG